MDEEPAVFDVADLTWGTGPIHAQKLVIGDSAVRLGPDGGEVFTLDDGRAAVVLEATDVSGVTSEVILAWDGACVFRLGL